MIDGCATCGVGTDRDRQETADGQSLVIDGITDPETGDEWEIIYCRSCAEVRWPDLAEGTA